MDIVAALQNLVVSGVAAFIAYLAWNEYQKPKLVAKELRRMAVVDSEGSPLRWRLIVENQGKSAARNCEAYLWLKGQVQETGQVVVSYTKLPWGNRRAEVFGNSPEDFSGETVIGSDNYRHLGVIRSYNGNLTPDRYVDTSDAVFSFINPSKFPDAVDIRKIGSEFLVNDERRRSSKNPAVDTANSLTPEYASSTEWEMAWVEIDCSNGEGPRIPLEIGWSDKYKTPTVDLSED